ncbi:uncharacterized protein NECHADRAFT_76992 [Fusarium vanettenii 77-13-4]|uniref:Uncharacterized protein n=1 Tax=Fusarium vanettenii (strain ATCC MYA-4622 / CBS 123669 / FGSC 9596 / NRRL 45880 / 77-13-4) TaxID=660122 RepID=C7ZCB3_FUSV7|nr:uncharacterized protein NECHADRAFT_76992 [Fusarium vanettenii 77-13-4]EEU38342.1 predicted protein [Fusarium vanettenii 77-13-4]
MCLCFPRRRGAKKQEQQGAASEAPRPVQLQSQPAENNTQEKSAAAPQPSKAAASTKAPKPYQARWVQVANQPAPKDEQPPADDWNSDERKKLSEERKPAQTTTTTSPKTGALNTQNQHLLNAMGTLVQQMPAEDPPNWPLEHKVPEKEHKPVRIERKSTPPPRNYEIGFTRPWQHYDREAARVRAARVAEHNDSNTYSSTSYNYRPGSSGGGGGGGGGYSGGDSGGCDSGGGGGGSDW